MASFDRGVFEQIWLRLCSQESSVMELAFLQTMIAVAGSVAPSTHTIAKVEAISGDGHSMRIISALQHLKSCCTQSWNKSILLVHTLHLISLYYFVTKQFDQAWKYCQGSIKASDDVGLLKEEENITSISEEDRAFVIRQRLKYDIYTLDGYLAFQFNRPSLLEKRPPISVLLRQWESLNLDDISSYWSHVKLQGANLSLQVASHLRQRLATSNIGLTEDIYTLERDIAAFLEASLLGVDRVKNLKEGHESNDFTETKTIFLFHLSTMLCHTLRCMLLQPFTTLESKPLLLHSANQILASLPFW